MVCVGGANISFETFGKTCDQTLEKMLCDVTVFYFVICAKGGDFLAFIAGKVTFVVLASNVIMASNNAPNA